MVFLDLTRAFDAVSRDGLWKTLARLDCPLKFLTIFRQLHEGQQGKMKHKWSLSGSFPISNDVKQGCVLVPTLFSSFFSIMLREAKEDLPGGIYIRFRTDDSLFNLRRILARTRTVEELITVLLFADDCAILVHMEVALQYIVNRISDADNNFGLTISRKKTEVLYQPPPREANSSPQISIDGTNLKAVDHFTYLGSVFSSDATVTNCLENRLSKANSSFGRVSTRVWQSHQFYHNTKIQAYRAVVVSIHLYSAETWFLYRKQIRLLERFHQRCLRSIRGIKWQD